MRGGKRPGAGRPVSNSVPVRFYLTQDQHKIYMANGGARWLKRIGFDVPLTKRKNSA